MEGERRLSLFVFSEYITYHSPEVSNSMDFFSSLFAAASQLKPESDTELAKDIIENNGNGVLKYYAK